jgi:hypothetical protein
MRTKHHAASTESVTLVLGPGFTHVLPLSVEREIAGSVPPPFLFVPTRAPTGWRYDSWDRGRETPGLFPHGHGLNIWLSTPPYPYQFCSRCVPRQPKGAGFHVYANLHCSLRGALKRFHVNKVTVAWSATFEDGLAWRCVRARHLLVMLSVSFAGIGLSQHPARDERLAVQHAADVARMIASARLLLAG